MSKPPLLLPTPRRLSLADGAYTLKDHQLIVLESGGGNQSLLFTARRLQAALRRVAGLAWEISASATVPRDQAGVYLSVVPDSVRHPQGYELSITPEGINAVAATGAGVFYAVCTLIQLVETVCDLPASTPAAEPRLPP